MDQKEIHRQGFALARQLLATYGWPVAKEVCEALVGLAYEKKPRENAGLLEMISWLDYSG